MKAAPWFTDKQERELSLIERRLKRLAEFRGHDIEVIMIKRLEEDFKSSSLPGRFVNQLRAEFYFSLCRFYMKRLKRLIYRREKAKGQGTKIRLENEYWETISLLREKISLTEINSHNLVLLNRV